MLFSSPDYPVFLIAVFFMYALARRSGWARAAAIVLLGDVVFVLVAKDPAMLWDPLGSVLLQLAAGETAVPTWHWAVGLAVLAGAFVLGRDRGGWIASERGQRYIARGIVVGLAGVGATVAIASVEHALADVTAHVAAHGHLVVLALVGIAIGAAQHGAHRALGRVVVLLVASCLFYHAWAAAMPGPYRYLLGLLLGTIVLDYYLALWIERTEHPLARKALVVVSLCSNLGILFFFKYTDFVTHDVLDLDVRRLHLILPAGISFHTFQSLSYTIDVYRRQLRATRSVVQFATFVLFFPQLVAGPIVRAQELLPQLAELPRLDLELATHGLFRIVVGLFKKIALADTLALVIVDRVFDAPQQFSGLEVLVGVYAYALQIYLDFSAYSDIAIGSAAVLGFRLPENFRTPYRSANLQEFWRRWHISLSTWLRDYLYITLGGSRGAAWRTYLNLSLTMLLGGLWHGASWTFVVWGALHGFGLAVTRFFQRAEHAGTVVVACVGIAVVGIAAQRSLVPDDASIWVRLIVAWVALAPLWAVATAWLGRDTPEPEPPPTQPFVLALGTIPELLRLAMCGSGALLLAALAWGESWTWLPLVGITWGLAVTADAFERGPTIDLELGARRALSALLVFHYVCLAWVFFRAPTFDGALAVLRQIAGRELDHANVTSLVTVALAVGFACHFFPDASFRWLRDRFAALPAWAQGCVLAAVALILRELGHAKVVPFIYFQF
ncbi:MAG TPA: MBOAT family O-acyltransferase [Kofleriaceae bacterium]|nr:MBOAT family O-acyltransferase [Kofleriaceae bacterium]